MRFGFALRTGTLGSCDSGQASLIPSNWYEDPGLVGEPLAATTLDILSAGRLRKPLGSGIGDGSCRMNTRAAGVTLETLTFVAAHTRRRHAWD